MDAGVGDEKQPFEADVCRCELGKSDLKGSHLKKALRPPERRQAIDYLVAEHGMSVRRSCEAVSLSQKRCEKD